MSLIKDLQKLVQSGVPVSGRVISVSNTGVVVSTASGQLEVFTDGELRPGDLVIVESGRAVKKRNITVGKTFYV